MGLTSFSGDVVRKKDVTIAKNYLRADEIETLNLLVAQFLDFAELQAKRQLSIRMEEWLERLDGILNLNGLETLGDAGRVSAHVSELHVHQEYQAFEVVRRELKEKELASEPDVVIELEDRLKSLDQSRKSID